MTVASKGLQRALARAGTSVLAIAEMQADDLLAEMNDEQKAEISAKLAASAAPPAPAARSDAEPDDSDPAEKKEPAEKAKKKEDMQASDTANASAHDRVKAVAKAVAEDDTCKGKADVALAMLADDDYATLSASGIVKLVGKQAVTTVSDPDAAARAEMKDAIGTSANSNLDAMGGGSKGKTEQSASVWDKAIARVSPNSAK